VVRDEAAAAALLQQLEGTLVRCVWLLYAYEATIHMF
jgi:hypothetical protein